MKRRQTPRIHGARCGAIVVESLGRGVYLLRIGDRQQLAYAVGPPEARWVFLDGYTFVVDISAEAGHRAGHTQDRDALTSPMPATVVRIATEAGARVTAGDVLIALEAMKMELPIRAPRDASVRTINCQVGDLVQPGVPLVDLD